MIKRSVSAVCTVLTLFPTETSVGPHEHTTSSVRLVPFTPLDGTLVVRRGDEGLHVHSARHCCDDQRHHAGARAGALREAARTVEGGARAVETLPRSNAGLEVWRQMATSTDPAYRRPEALAQRDSLGRGVRGQLSDLATFMNAEP